MYEFQASITRCPYCGRAFEATPIGGVCFHCDEIVRGGLHFKKASIESAENTEQQVQADSAQEDIMSDDSLEEAYLNRMGG